MGGPFYGEIDGKPADLGYGWPIFGEIDGKTADIGLGRAHFR